MNSQPFELLNLPLLLKRKIKFLNDMQEKMNKVGLFWTPTINNVNSIRLTAFCETVQIQGVPQLSPITINFKRLTALAHVVGVFISTLPQSAQQKNGLSFITKAFWLTKLINWYLFFKALVPLKQILLLFLSLNENHSFTSFYSALRSILKTTKK